MNFRSFFMIAVMVTASILSYCSRKSCCMLDTLKPEVGKLFPEFALDRVTQFKKKAVTSKDFRGKWLFLDFWYTGCKVCIYNLSAANSYQKEFRDKLTWMMVGLNDFYGDRDSKVIEVMYEKLRIMKDLQMVSAYDSILYKKFGAYSMPRIFIIDPSGVLRFITDGRDMSREKIQDLINGKPVSFFKDADQASIFDSVAMKSTLPERKLLLRSVLTRWNGEEQSVGIDLERYVRLPAKDWEEGYSAKMVPLFFLYNTAYFGKCYLSDPLDSLYGKVYPSPVLEMADASVFEYDYKKEFGKGTYNYNLKIDRFSMSVGNMMRYMQQDLRDAFHFDAAVEIREMPVWMLTAASGTGTRIRSNGGKRYNSGKDSGLAAGFTATNLPVKSFLMTLSALIADEQDAPFVDETHITGNIDITIEADMTNLESIRAALQKQGLDLVKGFQKMRVIIIRDM